MEKKTCIIGSPPLAELLAEGMKEHEYDIFLGLPSGEKTSGNTWNPRSPISTRALITEILRDLKHIDDAFLVFGFPNLKDPFSELPSRTLESEVDTFFKGPLFLIREMLNTLSRQGNGCLHIVLTSAPAAGEHPIDTALRKALIGFTDSLFALSSTGGPTLHGYQAVDMEAEEYASQIISVAINRQKNYHGRWHRFGSSQSFLSSFPFGGKKK